MDISPPSPAQPGISGLSVSAPPAGGGPSESLKFRRRPGPQTSERTLLESLIKDVQAWAAGHK